MLTVLALLAVAMPWLLLRAQDPEDVARDYLDALISGDLGAVRDRLAPHDGALQSALTESLRAVTPGGITGYTIEEVVVRGTTARVRVTLRSPVETHVQMLRLVAVTGGPLEGLRWELEPITLPLLTLGPRASTGVVVLNGRPVDIPQVLWTGRRTNRASVALHVLPGRYTVELPRTDGPLVPRAAEVYVPPVLGQWQTGLIAVDYQLDPDHEAQAREEILGALSRCLRSDVARPEGCPLGADLPPGTPGRWRLVHPPEITYGTMVGDSFDFRGQALVAEFLAEGSALQGERVSVDFGATLHRSGDGFMVSSWGYTTMRPWPR